MRSHCNDFSKSAEQIGEMEAEWIEDGDYHLNRNNLVTLYLHAGAYVLGMLLLTIGSPQMDRPNTIMFAKNTGGRVLATSYRLAPQFKFPCAIIDVISAYQYLLKSHDPSNIFISGISAGFSLSNGRRWASNGSVDGDQRNASSATGRRCFNFTLGLY
jgi:acetyl esterase/lipase